MKFKCKGWKTLVSKDENKLFITNGGASILTLNKTNLVEIASFQRLKNTTGISLSPDEKLLAYQNTSRHIAVHEIANGRLLLKTNALSDEGCGLFFLPNGKRIISSTWGRKIFIVDIAKGGITDKLIAPGKDGGTGLVSIENSNEYLFVSINEEASTLFAISLQPSLSFRQLIEIRGYKFRIKNAIPLKEDVFFYATQNIQDVWNETEEEITIEVLSDTEKQGVIFIYNFFPIL